MSAPIIATKLYIPPPRPKLVLRPRLIERLNEGLQRSLTLISAPAGFGKTTLISDWIAGCGRPAAWLSLDESDNDPSQFLAYLAAALQTIDSDIGAGVQSILQSPQPPPAELFLTSLINAVVELPQEFILVLDDYHRIEARPVHDALSFLLDHLPPQMHLAIASRSDPPLPLARLRAQRKLTELRAADLRFAPDEAAAFLNQAMGLGLSAADAAALESRTEGWIAGLQMAALSMQGRADPAGFIRAFTGSHRFIIDYLVEEVLQRQPERVRSFLLQTSLLGRLCGPLCHAVTGERDAGGMLEALERANLFVVPLDDQCRWYRYHHLFADMLQARTVKEQPDLVPVLHRRASEWYEQSGFPADAIRHALAAEDWERAARLVELAWPALRKSRQEATMLGWVKALPDSLIRARPVLSVVCAWALLDGGELEAAEARLRDAEQWLEAAGDGRGQPGAAAPAMLVADEAQFRSLPASIANARAYRAQALDDMAGTVTHARRALELLREDDYYERGTTAALLGLAHWASGDLEAAGRSFADGLESLQRAGGILIRVGGAVILAHIAMAQGRLREAERIYEQAIQLATAQGEAVLKGSAELYLGLAEICCERGDLDAAKRHLLRGKALGGQASMPIYRYLWCVVQARIKEAEGDLEGALDLLSQVELLFYRSPIPDVRPIAALKVRMLAAQGRLDEATAWVRTRGLSADDSLSYLREYEQITLARVLIARYRRDRTGSALREALGLLDRLLQAAEAGGRTASAIEILAQQALARAAQGDILAALPPLERAVRLAEPEGYIQIFAGEGAPMAHLLREAAARRIVPGYTNRLLAACEAGRGAGHPLPPATPPPQPLAEPLTQRERDILRLLETELSGPEIARELTIGLSTVRTYTKSIYRKLNVSSRRAAVRRASELDLL
jgi:LuxR family maltose regulon positive regulatory protein